MLGVPQFIPLTQDQVTELDLCDYKRFSRWKWYAWWGRSTKSFYAVRGVWLPDGKVRKVFLHREIMGLKHGDPRQVDHVNHDTLDNRRENLRIVSCRGNGENRRDQSAYGVGVYWDARCSKFQTQVQWEGRRMSLGYYETAAEARAARFAGLFLLHTGRYNVHSKEDRVRIRVNTKRGVQKEREP